MKYQIHVAIEYCHALEENDVLWLEVYGDVTIEGREQIEVKDYKEALTDSHENFWNTLNNWLKPEFSHQQYSSLILLTTQQYGGRATLQEWEKSDTAQRLAILKDIHQSSEARFKQASSQQDIEDARQIIAGNHDKKAKHESLKPSKALALQRKVLSEELNDSLIEALPKIKIITDQPDLEGLIAAYKRRYLKPIHPDKMDCFLNDLFGFMTNASKIVEGWGFTVKEFNNKFRELTSRYMIGSLKFPRVNSQEIEKQAITMNILERRFVKKINEIGGGEELILQATADLLHAQKYITELIKDNSTSQQDIDDYCYNELCMHRHSRSSAMIKCHPEMPLEQLKRESCIFFNDRCAQAVADFCSYDLTPVAFRNGIYHMLADEEPKNLASEFHWRLWK